MSTKNFTLLGIKPPTIFHIFQFHIRRTQQISHWTITAVLPRINHIRRYEKIIPTQRKGAEIMVSWKRSNNKTEEDCEEEESLFEDIVWYILFLIVGVL